MSYVRWSSVINDADHKSVWYIYHDVISGDTRDDQVLTIHLKGGETHSLTYDDLCVRLERDFFDDLFPEHTQHGVLRQCVEDFIKETEAAFPNG
jgi:YD repeat-containing protein